MPLNERGQRLRHKFRGQYGKKKGDSVFYAMENSGKLKKVLKAAGGKDASKDDFKTPSSMSSVTTNNPFSSGNQGATKTSSNINNNTNTGNNQKSVSTKKSFSVPIIGPITAGINLVQNLMNRPKKHPFSANTIKQTKTKPPMPMGNDGPPQIQKCPDGTMPPCKTQTITPNKPNTPNFLSGFKAYNSGGVSYGPPPKRGPNPQVPPVKMRNGKMTKKYKMSCPHRPDGIRGVGAAIRGHKFIGVK
ncbi:hypothetical protein HTVC023P_gp32 [Pelagibacter phage HTVC023P]|nr:hypothetical protein HTVC023P_gp32 [Pelagibacter phage HTVC023P]